MKKVLITGATGLVGTHLIAELLRSTDATGAPEYELTAVAHSEESWEKLDWLLMREGLSERPCHRVVAALEYIGDCRQLLQEVRPDLLFNCAARVAVGKSRDGEKLVTRNVEITHNLIVAALELPREEQPLFAHVSSVAALGSNVNHAGCIDENSIMENLAGASAYARSKFLSENEVWRGAAHGLRTVIVNPAVILGTMSPRSGFWLNDLLRAMHKGANRFWIDGATAFVSADDVARALVTLSRTPACWGKRYVLSAENLPYRRFLSLLARSQGLAAPRIRLPRWLLRLAIPFAPSMSAVLSTHKRYDGSAVMRDTPFRYTDLTETIAAFAPPAPDETAETPDSPEPAEPEQSA